MKSQKTNSFAYRCVMFSTQNLGASVLNRENGQSGLTSRRRARTGVIGRGDDHHTYSFLPHAPSILEAHGLVASLRSNCNRTALLFC